MKNTLAQFIRRCFMLPTFDLASDIGRRAHLLHTIIISLFIFPIFLFFGALLGGRTPALTFAVIAVAAINALMMRYWLLKGFINLVSYYLIVSTFLFFTLATFSLGTVRSPSAAGYVIIVLIAGLLFEMRGIVLSMACASLAIALLIMAENAGLLPTPDYAVTIVQWVTLTGIFGVTGLLAYFSNSLLHDALDRSKKEIHERMGAELEMRKLLLAVEQSPASIVITDLEGQIQYVNQRFTLVTGYSPEEALGQNPRILKTGETPEETHRSMWKALTAGQEWIGEFVNRKKDGSIYYELAHISPIINQEGEAIQYLAVKEDITERKQAEDALRLSEARYRALFEQTHDAVFLFNLEGRHIIANRRAAEMLGYTLEEIARLSVHEISAEVEESQRVLERLHAGERVPPYERLFRKKCGQVFPVEINMELIGDQDGKPLHFQSLVRDISQRKAVEAALKSANQQLILRMAEIEALQAQLREQALLDPLTGLYNRRYLNEALQREVNRTRREGLCLSILIGDIDHFKQINDTFGHQAGDLILQGVANLLTRNTRGSDLVCRYGGEEFIIVLPGISLPVAYQRAEEIRAACQSLRFCHHGVQFGVTMSFGAALFPIHSERPEEIIDLADQALYMAKNAGRNQVFAWDS
jgi:diguanylate cyclase (GGDEF)-like protein/PAS domain S-box-containing protein